MGHINLLLKVLHEPLKFNLVPSDGIKRDPERENFAMQLIAGRPA